MARPRVYDRDKLVELLNKYTDETEVPIVAEFCYQSGIVRQYLYEMSNSHKELSDAIKRCTEKKEAQLEKKALFGEVNPTMAIFSLKQLGWKDKNETKIDFNFNKLSDEEIYFIMIYMFLFYYDTRNL